MPFVRIPCPLREAVARRVFFQLAVDAAAFSVLGRHPAWRFLPRPIDRRGRLRKLRTPPDRGQLHSGPVQKNSPSHTSELDGSLRAGDALWRPQCLPVLGQPVRSEISARGAPTFITPPPLPSVSLSPRAS